MFKNFFFIQYPLYFPDEGVGGITEEPETPDEEEENEEGEGDTNEEEKEDSEEEGKENEEELVLTRTEYKDIKKEFPNLFTKFPELKHAFFREQQFSEMFPTVEEAQKALDAQNAYEEITASVLNGDADKFINELKSEDERGFAKFAKNFIPALKGANKDIYFDAIAPTVQEFIRNVYAHGRTMDNEEQRKNVQSAAKIVHKVLFGGEYDDIEKEGTGIMSRSEPNESDKKLQEERDRHLGEKYNTIYRDVTNVCYSKLDEEIAKGLEDLKSRPGLKNMVAKNIKEKVLAELEKDSNYMKRMQDLWKREQRNGFSGTLKNSLVTTFLAKAKAVTPKIRIDTRKEVLGKENNGNREDKDTPRITGGRESRGGGKKPMTVQRMKEEKITTTKGIFDAE
jgi:hypothetical protein